VWTIDAPARAWRMPLTGRPGLFAKDVHLEDAWQFGNVIVR
jgi:homospermidine synthase